MRIPVRYILKRIGFLVVVMWTAATINFLLPHLTPRDPIAEQITQRIAMMGQSAEGVEEMIESRKKLYGLDKPLWQQYLRYLWNTARFDLGFSIASYPKPVIEVIQETIWWTLGFVGLATIFAFVLGTVIGALVGWSKSPKFLQLLMPPLAMFSAVPAFILALVLIYYLAFKAKLFPLRGGYSPMTTPDWSTFSFWLEVVHHATLPALSLLLVSVGGWALSMRAMMVTVEGADFITFAEAKGLKGVRVFFQYALRNTMLPQVTSLAMQLGFIVSGSTLVENMFGYPGIGKRLGGAIASFDYYVIYGIVFFLVLGIALATFIIDLVYPLLDPRISYQEGG
jgi:peptide/nickel transport system permease protein